MKCSHPACFNAIGGRADFAVIVPPAPSKWHVFAYLNDTEGSKLTMRQEDFHLRRKNLSLGSFKVYIFHIELPDSVSTAILRVHIGEEKCSRQKVIQTNCHGHWLVTACNR